MKKTVELFTCDFCKKSGEAPQRYTPPAWIEVTIHDTDPSGHDASFSKHLCGDCVKLVKVALLVGGEK